MLSKDFTTQCTSIRTELADRMVTLNPGVARCPDIATLPAEYIPGQKAIHTKLQL